MVTNVPATALVTNAPATSVLATAHSVATPETVPETKPSITSIARPAPDGVAPFYRAAATQTVVIINRPTNGNLSDTGTTKWALHVYPTVAEHNRISGGQVKALKKKNISGGRVKLTIIIIISGGLVQLILSLY